MLEVEKIFFILNRFNWLSVTNIIIKTFVGLYFPWKIKKLYHALRGTYIAIQIFGILIISVNN